MRFQDFRKQAIMAGVGLSLLSIASMSGCATPGKRTGIGAGAGAATGAVLGGATGGWKGAAIGAGAGAIVGGAVGNYLDKQANELAEVAETQRTQEGILVKLKNDLLFDTGSSALKPEAQQQLNELGDILAKYPKDRIRVAGFTDNVGSALVNDELSKRRADAVRDVLVSRGVSQDQILSQGFGKSQPIASNNTHQGRALNRRVELHIDVPQAKG